MLNDKCDKILYRIVTKQKVFIYPLPEDVNYLPLETFMSIHTYNVLKIYKADLFLNLKYFQVFTSGPECFGFSETSTTQTLIQYR